MRYICFLLVFAALIGCENTSNVEKSDIMTDSVLLSDDIAKLADTSVFFGHQSVGNNILQGVEVLKIKNPEVKVAILEGHSKTELKAGTVLHSKVGKNCDPSSKAKAFQEVVEAGIGGSADVALFKFCYIDFTSNTDPSAVFREYKSIMDGVIDKFPQTVFVHTTVPLVKIQSGPKAWVKKILGRPLDGVSDNIIRHKYNQLVRNEYGDRSIFDIAKAESTKGDGSRQTFVDDGDTYYALVPGYTDDGGHLNETGQEHVAAIFLQTLVEAVKLKDGKQK